MVITTAFTLSFLITGLGSTSLPEIAATPAVPSVALLNASVVTVQTQEDTKAAKKKSDEEFLIEGDTLDNALKGNLKDAFKAFESGDFVEAERLISPLATREFILVQQQQLAELALVNMLDAGRVDLPLSRTSSYIANVWDAKSETPEAASRAFARSKGYALPVARLKAAASKLYFLKGLAQAQQGKIEEARKSYKEAIRLDGGNVDARIEYALLAMRNGDLITPAEQLKKLDKIFGKKCNNDRCRYAPDSKKRYSEVKLAYTSLTAASTQSE